MMMFVAIVLLFVRTVVAVIVQEGIVVFWPHTVSEVIRSKLGCKWIPQPEEQRADKRESDLGLRLNIMLAIGASCAHDMARFK